MNRARRRETASAILLDTFGRFLLQQRDNAAAIAHPGKIGLFGGHRKGVETYMQCLVREIHEELNYFIAPDSFEYLTSYEKTDPELNGDLSSRRIFHNPQRAH